MGIESIRDIPDDFELTEIQRRACYVRANGRTVVQTSKDSRRSWRVCKYPLFFMDFETVNPAIPTISRACDLTTNCRFSGQFM